MNRTVIVLFTLPGETMKEVTVISGKGGTGKTSLVASFAALARKAVVADCDVDAADLHLVLTPAIKRRENFTGGSIARIKSGYCVACGKCEELCRFGAVFFDGPGNGTVPKTFRVDPIACEGCGVCAWFCDYDAIEFKPHVNGQLFVSDTRFGPMVHARLGVAEENSGKLVTLVRDTAKEIAERDSLDLIISDGSPGIGCPVIASISGADMVVAVTEPTMSGRHDLERVLELSGHFSIPSGVVINKWDINSEMTGEIEEYLNTRGIPVLGRVRYDRAVTKAMVAAKSVVEYNTSPASDDIRQIWAEISERLMAVPEKE